MRTETLNLFWILADMTHRVEMSQDLWTHPPALHKEASNHNKAKPALLIKVAQSPRLRVNLRHGSDVSRISSEAFSQVRSLPFRVPTMQISSYTPGRIVTLKGTTLGTSRSNRREANVIVAG